MLVPSEEVKELDPGDRTMEDVMGRLYLLVFLELL